MNTVKEFQEYQLKKNISDLKEKVECNAKGEISLNAYVMFGCNGPITKTQEKAWLLKNNFNSHEDYINSRLNYYFGHLVPRRKDNMNDIIENTPDTNLTPDELAALMAKLHAADEASVGETPSAEGEVIFVAEDSTSQPSGTIH